MKKTENYLLNKSSISDFWSRLVTFVCGFVLLSIFLGYLDLFYWFTELFLLIALIWLTRLHVYFIYFFQQSETYRLSFFSTLVAATFIFWLILLIFYAPFPAFSGRDEGSYSNAAVYLAENAGFFFKPELLQYFNEEGQAHKSLNYPGFVIKNQQLISQFSPAYSTFLAIFFVFFGTVGVFAWANGFMVIGGGIAFYLILKHFIPRWSAFLALVLLMSNFTLIWFPRFTLSENLAFFVNLNALLFSLLAVTTGRKIYIFPLLLLSIVAPLVRPDGFWILFCGFLAILSILKKGLKSDEGVGKEISTHFKTGLITLFGFGMIIYSIFLQWPVYFQLAKDFVKWSLNKDIALKMSEVSGGAFNWSGALKMLTNIFPDLEKTVYFLTMEVKYGVLAFALVLIFSLIHFGFRRKGTSNDPLSRIFFGQLTLFSLPFLMILIAPQISQDHPWFLRRFFPLILPFGILAFAITAYRLANEKFGRHKYFFYLGSVLIFFLLSFPAAAYFLGIEIDEGRATALAQTAAFFEKQNNPMIFVQRESSGDGWKMFSLPLNSLYNLEAVYVHNPGRIIEMKELIAERFARGEKSFVILPVNAYSFEHELGRKFDLILEKQIDYENLSFEIGQKKRQTDFPLLEKIKNSVKIYSLNLKYN